MKILITGKSGYIAKSLINKLENYDITSIGRDDFDLRDRNQTENWFKDKRFDVIIHTAISGGSRLYEDNEKTLYDNIIMFYNLLSQKDKYNHMISFGSGAEIGYPTTPYGLSKNIISKIIDSEPNLINIRIFGVFDENELETRFIKSNIIRYLKKVPMVIHQDKYMDLFYMDDLVLLVDFLIKNPNIKTIDCSYDKTYKLSDIANFINNLSDYKCDIIIENDGLTTPYMSTNENLKVDLNFIGLETGIKKVYEKINKLLY